MVVFLHKLKQITMRNLTTVMIALLLICFHNGFAQIEDIPENAIMIDENTVIKDTNGNEVGLPEFMKMMDSGEWTLEPTFKENGDLDFLSLRIASEEEKIAMKTLPMQDNDNALIGQKAPDFSMTDLDGNPISLAGSAGKVLVLNFWFTTCKPCIAEIPELNEVYKKYSSNNDVVFASITFNKAEEVEQFLEKYPIQYPVVVDAKSICDLFSVRGFPTNIIIDKDGNILDVVSGGFSGIGTHISSKIDQALATKK